MSVQYDEEYYDILNAIDRLREECRVQYGSLYKASKAYGSHHLNKHLGTTAYSLGFKTLTKLCKFLNISYQYALLGGVKENFEEQTITLNNFYRIYKEIYEGEVDPLVYHSCWRVWTKKSTTFPLKYLIKLAKKSRKTIDFLLKG